MTILFFNLVSCKTQYVSNYSQNISSYYKECIEEYSLKYGENLYVDLEIIEDSLMNFGGLKGKSEDDYKNLFISLFQSDTLKYLFEPISKLMTYNLYFFYNHCSKVDSIDYKYIPLRTYKHILWDLRYNYSDETLIDLLFCSTDFNNEIMRMNVLMIFLTNLDNKYGSVKE